MKRVKVVLICKNMNYLDSFNDYMKEKHREDFDFEAYSDIERVDFLKRNYSGTCFILDEECFKDFLEKENKKNTQKIENVEKIDNAGKAYNAEDIQHLYVLTEDKDMTAISGYKTVYMYNPVETILNAAVNLLIEDNAYDENNVYDEEYVYEKEINKGDNKGDKECNSGKGSFISVVFIAEAPGAFLKIANSPEDFIGLGYKTAEESRILILDMELFGYYNCAFKGGMSDLLYYYLNDINKLALKLSVTKEYMGDSEIVRAVNNPVDIWDTEVDIWKGLIKSIKKLGIYDYILCVYSPAIRNFTEIIDMSDMCVLVGFDNYTNYVDLEKYDGYADFNNPGKSRNITNKNRNIINKNRDPVNKGRSEEDYCSNQITQQDINVLYEYIEKILGEDIRRKMKLYRMSLLSS